MNPTCIVCTDNFAESAGHAFVTNCGHVFHRTCINEWIIKSRTCPQCRGKLALKDMRRIYFNTEAPESSSDLQKNISKLEEKIRSVKTENVKLEISMKELKNAMKALEQKAKLADILQQTLRSVTDGFQKSVKNELSIKKKLKYEEVKRKYLQESLLPEAQAKLDAEKEMRKNLEEKVADLEKRQKQLETKKNRGKLTTCECEDCKPYVYQTAKKKKLNN